MEVKKKKKVLFLKESLYVFFGAARCTRAGASRGRVLGQMFVPGTGRSQHCSAQDVQQGATPGDEDGRAKLKSVEEKFFFLKSKDVTFQLEDSPTTRLQINLGILVWHEVTKHEQKKSYNRKNVYSSV